VEVLVANRVIDLVGDGVHLAIRAGTLSDSSLVARKFMTYTGGLWASIAYLKRKGAPKTPADLEAHECLAFSKYGRRVLRLTDGRGHAEVALRGRLAVDDFETLRNFVVRGKGIGMLIDYMARESGLVPVLPKWSWSSGALSFVYPGQRFVPANVRAFIDTALGVRKS
jgi:DNA-binding transcriptional LysR family regulator